MADYDGTTVPNSILTTLPVGTIYKCHITHDYNADDIMEKAKAGHEDHTKYTGYQHSKRSWLDDVLLVVTKLEPVILPLIAV